MLTQRLKNNINVPILLLWTVGFGIFFCGMPKYIDDIWYLVDFRYWFETQGIDAPENGGNIFTAGFPWEGFRKTFQYRYEIDNIRLSNLLATFFLLFPKWLGSGIMTILLGWSAILSMKIAGLNWRKSPALPLLLFFLTFVLPWNDQFGSLDFQFNYVFPGWLSLLLYHRMQKGLPGWWNTLLTFLIAFILGIAHEGFSVPFAFGLIGLCILFRKWRRTDVILAIIGLAIGFGILLSIPPIFDFIKSPGKFDPVYLLKASLGYLISETPAFFATFLLWIITSININPIRLLKEALFPFTLIFGGLLILIIIKTGAEIRMTYPIDILSIIGILRLLHLNFPELFRRFTIITGAGSAILLPITFIHLGYVDYYSFEFRRQRAKFEAEFLSNPRPYLFGDAISVNNTSPWTLGKIAPNAPYRMLEREYDFYAGTHNAEPRVPIIPLALQKADITRDLSAGENSPVHQIGGYYYIPTDSVPKEQLKMWGKVPRKIKQRNCQEIYCEATPLPFRSEADGREYCWLYFEPPWLIRHFRPVPTAVRLPAGLNSGN